MLGTIKTKRMTKKIILLSIIICVLFVIYDFYLKERYLDVLHTEIKSENFSPNLIGVEEMITQYFESYHIPALSVGIIEKGELSKVISRGTISKKSETRVDEKTIYRIASTGKMLIAIITLQMVNEKLIKLDDSILKYIGEQINEENKKHLESITIQNLLLHNSGLGRDWEAFSEQDIIDNINSKELDFKIGERWGYSNFGNATLTLILEKASDLSLAELLNKYVKNEFNLNHLRTYLSEEDRPNYAISYFPEFKLLKGEDKDYGLQTLTSGIYTNIESLAQLMIQQIDAYKLPDSISKSSPLILNKNKIRAYRDETLYGYGIFEHLSDRNDTSKPSILEHGGDGNGFACYYAFSPDKEYGFLMLTSSGGKWFVDLGINIDRILAIKYKNK